MVESRISLVRAPNPSAMTLSGTNSYLIDCGNGQAICIDPGPLIDRHIDALEARAAGMRCTIAMLLLTHSHPDHAPAAPVLKERTGSPIFAHHQSEFTHDRDVSEGDVLRVGEVRIRVMESPGHTFDHLVFYEEHERALFTGDTVLGEGYVVIAPPSGAMRPYQRTLERLLDEFSDAACIYGGHGEPAGDPQSKLRDYIAHRTSRQQQILSELARAPQTIPELVENIYRDTPQILWPAAARQMLAYLIALEQEGRVTSRDAQRPMTHREHAILNPDWTSIAGKEHTDTVEQELGAMLHLDAVRVYALV